jgi:S-adenosylmethionine:tRNA ribosyltransferase-isomerase
MNLSDFDYLLPKERIAQQPAEPRSSSKLMVIEGENIEHKKFSDIVQYFRKGDVLVLNDSKVIPAKLTGNKKTGGKVECLFIEEKDRDGIFLIKGKKIRLETEIFFKKNIKGKIVEIRDGKYRIRFPDNTTVREVLDKYGEAPLPPYIKRNISLEKYQTIYATKPGSIAAPTAGFHFTEELLGKIKKRGVRIAKITLHVGVGTFSPVKVEKIEEHKLDPEYFEIDNINAEIINKGERVIACGTTSVKALESAADANGIITPISRWSDLFIYPPYSFKSRLNGLITNFHLPKSTNLMLVCAYAGHNRILNAYNIAIKEGYRFYSFGDSMLILGGPIV